MGSIPPAGTSFFLFLSSQRQRGLFFHDMHVRTEPSTVPSDVPVLVFVNRAAGRRRSHAHLPPLRTLFESLGVPHQFVETSGAAELESAARQAVNQNHRVLLALGGDGTFQAFVNGVCGSDVMIGILPSGGGNDFAAALGLPSDPVSAAQIILKGKPRYVDLVRVRTAGGRTRLYAGGGGIGLDAGESMIRTACATLPLLFELYPGISRSRFVLNFLKKRFRPWKQSLFLPAF